MDGAWLPWDRACLRQQFLGQNLRLPDPGLRCHAANTIFMVCSVKTPRAASQAAHRVAYETREVARAPYLRTNTPTRPKTFSAWCRVAYKHTNTRTHTRTRAHTKRTQHACTPIAPPPLLRYRPIHTPYKRTYSTAGVHWHGGAAALQLLRSRRHTHPPPVPGSRCEQH